MISPDDDVSHFIGFVVRFDDVPRSNIVSPNALDFGLPRVGNSVPRFDAGFVSLRPKQKTNPFFGVGFFKMSVDFIEQLLRD